MLLIAIIKFSVALLCQAQFANTQHTTQCTSANQLLCYANENPFNDTNFAQTAAGRVYPNLLATQTVGKWGPTLLQDVYLIEKLQSLNRERTIPRLAHAKGAGAFGYFKVTHDISSYTKALFLQPGQKTDVVARFSTQVGEIGSSDTTIDAKGFAVKFYTKDGNYDFVGLNFPAFGHRDAMILPDLLHARMKNPQTHLQDFTSFWDITFIDGSAIHTFKLVNKDKKPTFAKFTFTSDAKDKSFFTLKDALIAAGFYPEYLTKELYDSIALQNFPTWTLNLQLMSPKQAKKLPYSIFDPTKYWNTTEFPLIPVGKLVLNRNPFNYFNDVEQAAYCPTRLVPGIEPTPDRLLVARMFAYHDAQLYRLGINHQQVPVNRCPFEPRNYERDGFMNVGTNGGNSPNFFPNTFHGPVNNNNDYYGELPFDVEDNLVDRIDLGYEDNFSQCKMYLESLSEREVDILAENIAFSLAAANPPIMEKAIKNLVRPISNEFEYKIRAALAALAAANAP